MFSRRNVLNGAAAAALSPLLPAAVQALDYPARTVRVMVPVAAGGTSDILTRLTARVLQERLGQTFLIENRPGAGGNLAAEVIHRAPADGYSLLSIPKGNVLANLLYDKLEFDFLRDFTPVAGIASGNLMMLMHPSVPARSLPEFLAYAKANPTKINYSTPGNGSDPHLSAELLKMMAGIQMTHVPYRGGALALTDLIAGNVQVMFSNLPVGEYLKTGKLIALGITSDERNKEFPEIAPISQTVPGYEVGIWYAYVARRSTPPEIVQALNSAMDVVLRDPGVIAGIGVASATPLSLSVANLEKLFLAEHDKWSKVIKAANIKPD